MSGIWEWNVRIDVVSLTCALQLHSHLHHVEWVGEKGRCHGRRRRYPETVHSTSLLHRKHMPGLHVCAHPKFSSFESDQDLKF